MWPFIVRKRFRHFPMGNCFHFTAIFNPHAIRELSFRQTKIASLHWWVLRYWGRGSFFRVCVKSGQCRHMIGKTANKKSLNLLTQQNLLPKKKKQKRSQFKRTKLMLRGGRCWSENSILLHIVNTRPFHPSFDPSGGKNSFERIKRILPEKKWH